MKKEAQPPRRKTRHQLCQDVGMWQNFVCW